MRRSPILLRLDAAIAEKIRELIATKGERFFSNKEERAAAEVFYRDRGFQPLWTDERQGHRRALPRLINF
jgi:hypothetical protein